MEGYSGGVPDRSWWLMLAAGRGGDIRRGIWEGCPGCWLGYLRTCWSFSLPQGPRKEEQRAKPLMGSLWVQSQIRRAPYCLGKALLGGHSVGKTKHVWTQQGGRGGEKTEGDGHGPRERKNVWGLALLPAQPPGHPSSVPCPPPS